MLRALGSPVVSVTVDLEQDCPPFLSTWRGVEEGMPRLLSLLEEESVRATVFSTGEAVRRYPDVIRDVVRAGHELGCHGDTHRSFRTLNRHEAVDEIARATDSLAVFRSPVSFRAPFLQLPAEHLPLLAAHGYTLDSSEGRHKTLRAAVRVESDVLRIPASVTSSTLRWPSAPRNLLFARLRNPAVLFVHPWEFVDFRRSDLRFDCRFRTGDQALTCLRATIRFFKRRHARFSTMNGLLRPGMLAAAAGQAWPDSST